MKFVNLLFLVILACTATSAQSMRSLVNDGVTLYDGKKYSDAEVNFRKGLEKEPDNFVAHFNLGDSYFMQEKYEDAIKSYQ
ncbi:MAG TPA: tetratricopeptide repeat protein, partial [Ignavibacteriaceae bacterium]|nr:tetratricopeptide repeat protein [Ignavibacteriaceae bacterium]